MVRRFLNKVFQFGKYCCGGGGQLGGKGSSLAEVQLQSWRQRFRKQGGSAAAAGAAQQWQWQLCSGGKLGNNCGSLAAAAWGQRSRGSGSGSAAVAAAA